MYFFFFRKRTSNYFFFFFSSRRRHTISKRDWSSDVCSSDLHDPPLAELGEHPLLEARRHQLEEQRGERGDAEAEGDEDPADDAMPREQDQQQGQSDHQEQAVQPLEGDDRRADANRDAVAAAPQVRTHVVTARGRRDRARGLTNQLDRRHRAHRDLIAQLPHPELRAQGTEPDHWQIERERRDNQGEVRLLQRRPDLVWMADCDYRRSDGDTEQNRRQAAGP